jgi:hypothetical protein
MSPFTFFGVASFFIGYLFNEPLHIFVVASFFIGCLFNEPMNEVSGSMPLFMAPLICVKTLVKFPANLVSCFDATLTYVFEE